MYEGSCLCGAIAYRFTGEPVKVSHCHCRMCQKQHGAAFATYARVALDDLRYTRGAEHLAVYNSSGTVTRKFCTLCGSSLEWCAGDGLPGFTSIALATVDTPCNPGEIPDIHTDTRASWLPPLPAPPVSE